MILYRLKCKKRHTFEAWFSNSAAYDRQAKRGLLSCPTCGSKDISKAIMAPNISKRASKKRTPVVENSPDPPKPETQRFAAHGELAAAMRRLKAEIESKSEYVGPRFPEEARKIHYEETPARGIHGEATADEARALSEEGIEFFQLPILPEEHN